MSLVEYAKDKKAPEYKLRSKEIISKILRPYATQGNECLA